MTSLGALTFAAPWLLLGLLALPVLWWLLRLMPPAPRRLSFPAIRLLFGLKPKEETPDRTPWWLVLLRVALAGLVIVALAHPLIDAADRPGRGPLVLAIDDGWAAAARWGARVEAIEAAIGRAERAGLPVYLLTTAPRAAGEGDLLTGPLAAPEALRRARALVPQPWPGDRGAALKALDGLPAEGGASVLWLADGLAGGDAKVDAEFAQRLQRLGNLQVFLDPPEALPLLQLPPAVGGGLTVRLSRVAAAGARTVALRATGEDGRLITREEIAFPAGAAEVEQAIRLPTELANRVTRLSLEGHDSAGSVVLLDERWRRRPVGLVSGGPEEEAQPLLGDLYYLDRALAPFTELRQGELAQLMQGQLAVIVLADIGTLGDEETARLADWIERGGVLLRFAGERLAENAGSLLPVRLRIGERTLGGAMSWARPVGLAPFPADSPFAGLPVPADVLVKRQVLAEPEPDLGAKTWARLADGTPLVTGERRGAGWLVLVHTTANTDWSNLSLSGLFVDLLRRVVGLSQGVLEADVEVSLAPLQTLDGFGRLGKPPATALPAAPEVFADAEVGPSHPPGFYGTDQGRRALNLSARVRAIEPLAGLPSGAAVAPYGAGRETDLKPWLLAAAAILLLIDMMIALALRGLFIQPAARRVAATLLLGAILLSPPAPAQETATDDEAAIAATRDTRLAYVRTGSPQVDATSSAGLQGLVLVLKQRTAVEAAAPMGVDVERDELAFFPLLYWPIAAEQPLPSAAALRRLNAYLRNGGMIFFDTRDQGAASTFGGLAPGAMRLRELARGLDIPPLAPLPPDHVLTKSFYLLRQFPGRWAGGTLWVEPGEGRINDGVASVLIGGNDYAAAWAVDDFGSPLFPAVPGGEHQRETAYRFGVNLVMYALTGNYKSDQVHVPAILERLGQ